MTKRPHKKKGIGRQDAKSYRRLLDDMALSDAREGIRQGLEDAAKGRIHPAHEVFAAIRIKHGIPLKRFP